MSGMRSMSILSLISRQMLIPGRHVDTLTKLVVTFAARARSALVCDQVWFRLRGRASCR